MNVSIRFLNLYPAPFQLPLLPPSAVSTSSPWRMDMGRPVWPKHGQFDQADRLRSLQDYSEQSKMGCSGQSDVETGVWRIVKWFWVAAQNRISTWIRRGLWNTVKETFWFVMRTFAKKSIIHGSAIVDYDATLWPKSIFYVYGVKIHVYDHRGNMIITFSGTEIGKLLGTAFFQTLGRMGGKELL